MFKELINTCDRLLAPPNCHVCGTLIYEPLNAFDTNLCRACSQGIPILPANACPLCGATVHSVRDFEHGRCPGCRNTQPEFDRLEACFMYNGIARQLIHQFKYQGRAYLAKTLTQLMLTVIHKDAVSVFDALVPIPLSATRLRERTFNQADTLAKELAHAAGVPIRLLLERTKETRPQATFSREERQANVEGAFRVIPGADPSGQRLLLIDDIVTTGATASAAARVLKEAQAEHVAVCAFAKG